MALIDCQKGISKAPPAILITKVSNHNNELNNSELEDRTAPSNTCTMTFPTHDIEEISS